MKRLTVLCLVAGGLLATTGISQEDKKDEITYDMGHLEKTYGILFKSAKLQKKNQRTTTDTVITMTLEFTKDLPERSVNQLGGNAKQIQWLPVRDLFAGQKDKETGRVMRCYFFDEDGVVVAKQPPGKIEGEVSGKEGDAFRISQSVPSALLEKTKKISFREEAAKK